MLARLARRLLAVAALLARRRPRRRRRSSSPGQHLHLPERDRHAALDCYLDAVVHLYTMCRHVKSIEIIEFGYEKSQEGVNGAKSEYCVDKQKLNITRPYQAALREATPLARRGRRPARAAASSGSTALAELQAGSPARPTRSTRTASARSYDELRVQDRRGPRRRSRRAPDGGADRRRRGSAKAKAAAKPTATAKAELSRRRNSPAPDADTDADAPARRRARRDLRRRRHARARAARASASARSSSRWPQAVAHAIADARPAGRRGRHRHRQDLRLPRAGAAVRRQGDRLHRHQDAAGPAVRARPAAGARRARRCR